MNLSDFLNMRLKNAERRVARWLKNQLARRRLTASLDALTMPPESGSDVPIRRLPRTCSRAPGSFRVRIALRDMILSNLDSYSPMQMQAATLWCQGHSTRSIIRTLGLANSSGYRTIAPFLKQLQEAAHE